MLNVNNFEDRVVKFKRIDAEGKSSTRGAEIRQMDFSSADMPSSVTARLTDPLNFVITLKYDHSVKKFRGPLGTDTWESDFNVDDFVSSAKMGTADSYIKRRRRR